MVDRISGTNDADRISDAGSESSLIELLDGNDNVSAGKGNDTIFGGDGDDAIDGGSDNDILYGEAGDDSLNGGSGAEQIFGGAGADEIYGGAGANLLFGGSGNDFIYAGSNGNSTITGGTGDDFLNGPVLRGATEVTTLVFRPGDGNDTTGHFAPDRFLIDLTAFSEISSINDVTFVNFGVGGGTKASLEFGSGDSLTFTNLVSSRFESRHFIFAGDETPPPSGPTNGDDVLAGTDDDDTVSLLGGFDRFDGNGGNDRVLGGTGSDTLFGGDGSDTLLGEDGDDTLIGDAGNDLLFGGDQNDVVSGGDGDDTIGGGSGDLDELTGGDGADMFVTDRSGGHVVIRDLTSGEDLIDLSSKSLIRSFDDLQIAEIGSSVSILGPQELQLTLEDIGAADLSQKDFIFRFSTTATEGDDHFNDTKSNERISLLGGDDTLVSNFGSDTIFGGDGADSITATGQGHRPMTVRGEEGDDTISISDRITGSTVLIGGSGNDSMDGAAGIDSLYGDDGHDVLIGGDNADLLFGGGGNDTLFGGAGSFDRLTGGEGNDLFVIGVDDRNDVIRDFTPGADRIDLTAFGPDISFSDITIQDTGSSVAVGVGAIQLTLYNLEPQQLSATDFIFDTSAEPVPSDTPTNGDDNVSDTSANDLIFLLDGDDTLSSNTGNDSLFGGRGDDSVSVIGSGERNLLLAGDDGNDTLSVSADVMGLSTLIGGRGADSLAGGGGTDRIDGNQDNDFLAGGGGTDLLFGGTGDDTIDGGTGRYDKLTGGDGADTFVVRPGNGDDIIRDFTPGEDIVDLTALNLDVTFDQLAIQAIGLNTYVDLGNGDSLLFYNTSPDALAAQHFRGLAPLPGDDSSVPPIGQNLLVNGGFELDGDGNPFTDPDQETSSGLRTTNLQGWDIIGTDDNVDLIGRNIFQPAPQGLHAIEFRQDTSQVEDGVSQAIDNLQPDLDLTISLRAMDYTRGELQKTDQSIEIVWNGESIATLGRLSVVPERFTFDVVSGSGDGTDRLTILDVAGRESHRIFVDDVRLFRNDGPMEENSTVASAGNDEIFGDDTDNSLNGLSGRDIIFGGGGTNLVDGGVGNDTIYGGNGTGTLLGGSGDDFLMGFGEHYEMHGGEGDDFIQHGLSGDVDPQSDDTIFGGAGNDSLNGVHGDNQIFGGDGNDRVAAGLGDDLLDGGAGNDEILDFGGADTIKSGTGDDSIKSFDRFDSDRIIIEPDSGHDTLDGFSTARDTIDLTATGIQPVDLSVHSDRGGTLVQFGNGSSLFFPQIPRNEFPSDLEQVFEFGPPEASGQQFGTGGADDILGTDGADTIDGLAGPDTIGGQQGNDSIIGGAGADRLRGGQGDDTLLGGVGTDRLRGDLGDDLLDGGEGDFDVADFFNAQEAVEADLAAGTATGAGTDTLRNIERLEGSDFNDTLRGDALDNVIAGAAGDDIMDGRAGDDLFGIDVGHGDDTVDGGDGEDRLLVVNKDGSDLEIEFRSSALKLGPSQQLRIDDVEALEIRNEGDTTVINTGERLTNVVLDDGNDHYVAATFHNGHTVDGKGGDDEIRTRNGDDSLTGGDGNDILNASFGRDTLFGGNGNDTLMSTAGDGDLFFGGDGNDRIAAGRSGDSTISGGLGNDTITGSGDGNSVDAGAGDDHITISGTGVSIAAGTGDDFIRSNADAAQISGGEGDDYLIASGGASRFDGGDGADYIDVIGADHTIRGGAGDDIIASGSATETIVVETGMNFDRVTRFQINEDRIDVSALSPALSFAELDIKQAGGNTHIDFGNGDILQLDHFTASVLSARDFIGLAPPPPVIGTADADDILGTNGDDIIDGLAGPDTIGGQQGNDSIVGGAGADQLRGGRGNDTLLGGVGTDRLRGDLGDDLLDGGEGDFDVADFFNATEGVNADLAAGTASGAGDDTLRNIERLEGSAFDDILRGDAQNNVLSGGAGDDVMDGRGGDDLIGLDVGTGDDTVFGGEGQDRLLVVNQEGTSLQVVRDDAKLRIGGEQEITIRELEELELRNTGSTTLINRDADILAIQMGDGNDVYRGNVRDSDSVDGGDGTDLLYGYGGNDTLNGGAGIHDKLTGGDGADTFVVSSGNGADIIRDFQPGTDKIDLTQLDLNQTFDELSIRASGQHTLIDFGNGDSLLLYVTDPASLSEGDFVGLADIVDPTASTNGPDRLTDTEADEFIFGLDGDDTINSFLGNDTLFGGNGNDEIRFHIGDATRELVVAGDAGDDVLVRDGISSDDRMTLIGGAGNDSLFSGNGPNDELFGGDGDDSLFDEGGGAFFDAGAGSDTLHLRSGIDRAFGGDGNDLILTPTAGDTIDGGAGNDTVEGFEPGFIFKLESGFDDDELLNFDPDVDRIDLSGLNLNATFDDLDLVQDGDDVLLTVDGQGTVRLTSLDLANVTGSTFLGLESATEPPEETPGDGGEEEVAVNRIEGTTEADTLTGSDEAEEMFGGIGPDLLLGNGGNDLLEGDGGFDTLDGGAGADTLTGSSGGDTFVISADEDSVDLVRDFVRAQDKIDVSALNVTIDALTLQQDEDDAIVSIGGAAKLRLTNTLATDLQDRHFTGFVEPAATNRIEGSDSADTLDGTAGDDEIFGGIGPDLLRGDDGDDLLEGGFGFDTLDGGAGADTLTGGGGGDTFVLSPIGGVDLITDFNVDQDQLDLGALNTEVAPLTAVQEDADTLLLQGGATIVRLAGVSVTDLQFRNGQIQSADEFLRTTAENGALFGGEGDDTLLGDDNGNLLDGGTGNDSLIGKDDPDQLIGGPGNDTMSGGSGRDVFQLNEVGSGFDLITDWGGDLLDVTGLGISFESIETIQQGDDLLLRVDGQDLALLSNTDITDIGRSDIRGTVGHDVLSPGDDLFEGGTLKDVIIHAGPGNDTLIGNDGSDSLDGGADDDVLDGGNHRDTLIGGVGNDSLFGGAKTDKLFGGDGDDVLDSGFGAESIFLREEVFGGAGDDTIRGHGHVSGGEGNDVINVARDATSAFGDEGNDVMTAGVLNDTLFGGDGADTLIASTGLNFLAGGAGADVYVVDLDDHDIDSAAFVDGEDRINVQRLGNSIEDFDLVQDGDDVIVMFGRTRLLKLLSQDAANITDDDLINLASADSPNLIRGPHLEAVLRGGAANDTIFGGDQVDTIFGGAGDDVLAGGRGGGDGNLLNGGAGQDTLVGGRGNNTYVIDDVSETDLILNFDSRDRIDIKALGFQPDELEFLTFDEPLLVNNGSIEFTLTDPTVLVRASGTDIVRVRVLDNAELEISDFITAPPPDPDAPPEDAIFGTDGADTLDGTAEEDEVFGGIGPDLLRGGDGNDLLEGGFGFDTLEGGAGADTLTGGAGGDHFVFDADSSSIDVVTDFGDSEFERLDFSALGPRIDNLEIVQQGDDTILRIGDETIGILQNVNADQITDEYLIFGSAGSNFSVPDDALLLEGDTGNNILAGTSGRDAILGFKGTDSLTGAQGDDLIAGGIGQDTLRGGEGNDTLMGELAGDFVEGDAGRDEVFGGHGSDTLGGGDGDDQLFGGQDDDFIGGDAGDDALDGGAGSDVLNGGAGADTLTGDAGADRFIATSDDSIVDMITDFVSGTDTLDLSGLSTAFGNLTFEDGDDGVLVLDQGNGVFRLQDVAAADLDEGDFRF